jgi:hypothetical protein
LVDEAIESASGPSALVQWEPHTHVPACSEWPTPRASDSNGGGVLGRRRKDWNMKDAARNRDGRGPLSPDLTEWLMGLPAGWTDLRPSETPWFPQSPSASGN